MTLTKTQKANFEYAYQLLTRAKKDFAAFKRLVPFDKKTRQAVRCSDPALAVYLLQQSIEKTVKAVATASGRYSYKKLKGFSHNSPRLLLDFFDTTISLMISTMGLEPMFKAFGIDAVSGLDKIREQKRELKKTAKDKKKDEVTYIEQFASMTFEQIERLLNLLLLIRGSVFLEIPSSIFGPHSKVRINTESIKINSPEDFIDSMLPELQTKLHMPELTDEQRKVLITFYNILSTMQSGIIESQSTEKDVELKRDTDEWLSQWSMLSLILLAAITFPHESTSRYPVPKGQAEELGCGDYDDKLGIVNSLGQLGYVTELTINEIKPQLETIAYFFSVAVPRLSKTAKKEN
jgi:hypothetical protein